MRFAKRHWILGLLTLAISVVGCGIPWLPPEPKPPIVEPDVKPVQNAAWVYVVEETADRTPEIATILADDLWHSGKFKFRVYDKDVPEAADIVKASDGIALPAIIIADSSGKVAYKGKLPDSVDGIKTLLGIQ